MKILIATGIYPPEVGGPAYYAKSLKDEFEKLGHTVTVRTYTTERSLPMGIRHVWYFFKTLPAYLSADWTLVLDTFSVGFPVACMKKLVGGTMVVRTGGDFLWEHYVERITASGHRLERDPAVGGGGTPPLAVAGEKILFSQFYDAPRAFTTKEKLVFSLTKFVLRTASRVVFSTAYQRDVWMKPYAIDSSKVSLIENAYERQTLPHEQPTKKDFFCAIRGGMKWKNTEILEKAFVHAHTQVPDIELDLRYDISRDTLLERLRTCYAVILVSLGDISPNFILEALSYGKPIIVTNENGLRDRLGETVMYVDPLDENDIANAMVRMADQTVRDDYARRSTAYRFEHTYQTIASEFVTLVTTISDTSKT